MCECKLMSVVSAICGWTGPAFSCLQYKQCDVVCMISFWHDGIQKIALRIRIVNSEE